MRFSHHKLGAGFFFAITLHSNDRVSGQHWPGRKTSAGWLTSLEFFEKSVETFPSRTLYVKVAEREGFEPSVTLYALQRFSKPSLSTTQPSLQFPRWSWAREGSMGHREQGVKGQDGGLSAF
jgi:hypothetical protein